MPQQVHIRLDDRVHTDLTKYAIVANKTKQECIVEALALLFEEKARERKNEAARFRFIDLFAGIGGMRIAFETHGGECVFSSEWDKYCQRTYFENFGVMPFGDITKINEHDIPDHDILVAGFPCQPFSIAGVSKKNSLGRATGFLDKTQGTLFFDVVRIIDAKRPRAFLLESVKNLKSHDKGNTWKVITDALSELDYEVFPCVLDGQLFSPQHRERVFIVGYDRQRYGNSIDFKFSIQAPSKRLKIKDILEESVEDKYTLTDHLWQYLQDYAAKHQARGNGFGFGMVDLNGVTRTLSARYYKDGSEILIPQEGKIRAGLLRANVRVCRDIVMISRYLFLTRKHTSNSAIRWWFRLSVRSLKEWSQRLKPCRKYSLGGYKMDNIANKAIQAVHKGQISYCKFLSANDTGDPGAHQAGIYIEKNAISILFDEPGVKGENKDKFVKVRWQDDFTTDSRFIYYGTGTRNEYRITRFGRGFPFLQTEHTEDLFVFIKNDAENYSGYILETEDEINAFLDAYAMSPTDTGTIIQKEFASRDTLFDSAIAAFVYALTEEFPSSAQMSAAARHIFNDIFNHEENIILNPDSHIISWIDAEYSLFRSLEFVRYRDMITTGFQTVEQFIDVANMVLNRRKSRAGKSLEHHLAAIFDGNELIYQSQSKTEGNKRPDFIFPGEAAYHDSGYPFEKLIFLGAKTTCKDRWRQVINEANRIRDKHLFTLQQGISAQQLTEMESEHITLVVPATYIAAYPQEKRGSIWTLQKFIAYAKEKAAV